MSRFGYVGSLRAASLSSNMSRPSAQVNRAVSMGTFLTSKAIAKMTMHKSDNKRFSAYTLRETASMSE